MSLDDERQALNKQLDYLTQRIADLEALVPSAEEKAFLQNEKLARERATWLWQKIRSSAPWVAVAGGVLTAAYNGVNWFLAHFTWKTPGP